MKTVDNMHELRRRILATYHQDGLAEMILGAWLLSLGLSIVLDATTGFRKFYVFSLGPLAALTALYPLLKRRVTVPRVGYVKLPQRQAVRAGRVGILAGCLMLAALVVLYASGPFAAGAMADYFLFSFPLALAATAFAIGAVKLQNRRWLGYAITLAIVWVLGLALLQPGWIIHATGFTVAGALPVIGGAITLIAFLNTHPRINPS